MADWHSAAQAIDFDSKTASRALWQMPSGDTDGSKWSRGGVPPSVPYLVRMWNYLFMQQGYTPYLRITSH